MRSGRINVHICFTLRLTKWTNGLGSNRSFLEMPWLNGNIFQRWGTRRKILPPPPNDFLLHPWLRKARLSDRGHIVSYSSRLTRKTGLYGRRRASNWTTWRRRDRWERGPRHRPTGGASWEGMERLVRWLSFSFCSPPPGCPRHLPFFEKMQLPKQVWVDCLLSLQ